jgi:Uma2 family endonuclease
LEGFKQKQTGDPSMLQSDPWLRLPTGEELPGSDDTPVDNELQNFVPNNLLLILGFLWATRNDWFFAADMGVYHNTGTNPRIPIVPDGFLSLGVPRLKGGKLRKNYVVWEENDIVPILTLEVVSQTYGDEYDDKMDKYARLGVLYYVIYNPEFWQRDKHAPFEVYRLVDGVYQLQAGEPVWMPEIGLGIGRGMGIYCGLEREWLYWYDEAGNRYQSPEEQATELRNLLEQYQIRFGNLPDHP